MTTNAPTLDLEFCRAQFPALAATQGSPPWALLDNAGGSVTPRQVTRRITEYLETRMVQLGASYPLSVDAETQVSAGRSAVAELIGANPDEVVLGASTTQNLQQLAAALPFEPGDEVVVTNLDHEANIGCFRRLERRGLVVREWKCRVENECELRFEDLEPLLGPRTRLVCFTHCSNLVGAITPVAELTRYIHAAGAQVCVDGVAYAPHRLVDVKALGVDYYAFSLYKTYGPHLGALYVRMDRLRQLQNQNHYFLTDSADEALHYRLMPGNVSHELAAGLPGVVDYLEAVYAHHFGSAEPTAPKGSDRGGEHGGWEGSHGRLGGQRSGAAERFPERSPAEANAARRARLSKVFELFTAHEERLQQALLNHLAALPQFQVLGPAGTSSALRAPTVSFWQPGQLAEYFPTVLDRAHIAIRWGHFYAHRLVEALGLHAQGGVVRASFAHYNSLAEAERLGAALAAASKAAQ